MSPTSFPVIQWQCTMCEKCCCKLPGIYTALGFQQPLPTSLAPCLTCTLSSQPFLDTSCKFRKFPRYFVHPTVCFVRRMREYFRLDYYTKNLNQPCWQRSPLASSFCFFLSSCSPEATTPECTVLQTRCTVSGRPQVWARAVSLAMCHGSPVISIFVFQVVVQTAWHKRCIRVLIRWPINRSNRFSDFLRWDRLYRFGKIIKSIFSKFWKREFHFFWNSRISSDFWSFGKNIFFVYNPNFPKECQASL